MIRFTAMRISSDDNVLFPDIISIDANFVTYSKGKVFGYTHTKMQRDTIIGVTVDAHIFFADIYIYTKGNKNIIATGFLKKDAKRIANILS